MNWHWVTSEAWRVSQAHAPPIHAFHSLDWSTNSLYWELINYLHTYIKHTLFPREELVLETRVKELSLGHYPNNISGLYQICNMKSISYHYIQAFTLH